MEVMLNAEDMKNNTKDCCRSWDKLFFHGEDIQCE